MGAKINTIVKLFSQEHVKTVISFSPNNCPDFQHMFKTQKLKLRGEVRYSKQTRQIFQSE